MIGIYKIENKVNGKIYVGSSVNVKKRWSMHKCCLRNNKHQNSHLQSSWNKHGEQNFKHSLLQECLPEEIKFWEEHYIELYESHLSKKGYNVERYSQGQKIVSEETKEKQSESHIGIQSGENNPFWGKQHSQEFVERMTGENNPNFGKHLSDEQKRKLSERMSGENHPMFGKFPTEETKEKMSERKKGLYDGENNPAAILNWEKVREIRKKYIPRKYTAKMLAKEYDVGLTTIYDIFHNRIWKENNDIANIIKEII